MALVLARGRRRRQKRGPAAASAQKHRRHSRTDGAEGVRFEVSVPAATLATPLTGRVFVIISKVNDREPRLQTGRTGAPFFGRDVEGLEAGAGRDHRRVRPRARRSRA